MGLFDQITKGLVGQLLGGGSKNPLLDIALGLVTNQQTGGLAGLVQSFKDKGLNDIVSSWVGTGQNQPISGNQIQNVLGSALMQQLAQKMGSSGSEVSNGLAALLPQLIDKLTPDGNLPDENSVSQGLNRLKKEFLSK